MMGPTDHRPTLSVPSPITAAANAFVAGRVTIAEALGRDLAEQIQDPEALAAGLQRGLRGLADPAYLAGQQFVAPGIGRTHGVRSPLLRAVIRSFVSATRRDSPTTLLLAADRLLREPELEAHWFAFGLLDRTLGRETERTWQLIRRAGREAADWITVDTLAHTVGKGVLAETFRWAELEQLVYSPSRWERRLVGSTIASLPFSNRTAGRQADVAARGLALLGELIGDAEPDVQKALSWAYRSMTAVDSTATSAALDGESVRAAESRDGNRAWVIRDTLSKLDPTLAATIRSRLDGIRRTASGPSTSDAAATAARFSSLGLGRPMPEPPLT